MTTQAMTTHDRLRREAAGLFSKRGYGGTSMSDIARRVGVRKASLYNYYDSKADLMLELIERGLLEWEESCQIEFDPEATVEERLGAYLTAALRFAQTHPQAVGIIRLAAGQMPRDLRLRVHAIFERHEGRWRQMLRELFLQAIESGEVLERNPEHLSLFWGVFVDGLIIRQVFVPTGSLEILDQVPALWGLFWRGVSGHAPTRELAL